MMWVSLLVFITTIHLDSVFGSPRCSEVDFYKPYVKVLKKRNDQVPKDELTRTGFLDLTAHTSSILCVNGPAILYEDAEEGQRTRRILGLDMLSSAEDEEITFDIPKEGTHYSHIMDQVKAIEETLKNAQDEGEDPSPEVLAKILEQVEESVDKIDNSIGENDPSSQLVSEILDDISETKDAVENAKEFYNPSPEVLNNVIREVQSAMDSMDTSDTSNPTSKVLRDVLEDVAKAVTTMQVCGTGVEEEDGANCNPSSYVLAKISNLIVSAKDAIDTLDNTTNKDGSNTNPSSVLLAKILDQLSEAQESSGVPTPLLPTEPEVDMPNSEITLRAKNYFDNLHTVSKIFNDLTKIKSQLGSQKEDIVTKFSNLFDVVKNAQTQMEICTTKKPKDGVNCDFSQDILPKILDHVVETKALMDMDSSGFLTPGSPSYQLADVLDEVINATKNETKNAGEKSNNENNDYKLPEVVDNDKQMDDYSDGTNIPSTLGRNFKKPNPKLQRAILRRQRSVKENDTRAVSLRNFGYDVYKQGEVKIYSHKCFTINRIPKAEIMARRSDPKKAKAALGRSTPVLSGRSFGIYLLGNADDYRTPNLFPFVDPAFGHVVDGISKSLGMSFVAVGLYTEWCSKSGGKDLTLCQDTDTPNTGEVCLYGGGHAEYNNLFPIGTQTTDFDWTMCNTVEAPTVTPKIPTVYENFSSIDPAVKKDAGSKPIKHPYIENVPAFMDTSMFGGLGISMFGPTTPASVNTTTTAAPILYPPPKCRNGSIPNSKICKIPLSLCQRLPSYDKEACVDNLSSGDNACEYVNAVMNLTKYKPDPNNAEKEVIDEGTADADGFVPKDIISWKHDIINLIDSIYRKICRKVNPEFSPAVGRVIMHYLVKANENSTDPNEGLLESEAWDFLKSELKICNKHAQEIPLVWSESENDDAEERRRKRDTDSAAPSILNEHEDYQTVRNILAAEENIDPNNYVLPKNVKVMVDESTNWEKSAVPLYYYEDAAELDFELSVPIDLHFKIFATVAGYCNLHYTQRKSETFPRLYSTYYEDIFNHIESVWINPADSSVMKYLFSEYTDPAVMKWIDSCLEASYLVSDSPTYRPPRPLIIPEGKVEVANYFLDEPPSRMARNVNQTQASNDSHVPTMIS